MRRIIVHPVALLIAGLFTTLVTPRAQAGESHVFAPDHGLDAHFYLIGGQYSIYVNARRPSHGAYAPESSSCLFGGNLQRVWPTHDSFSLGAGIIVSTLVPYRIGPKPITLSAGLYAIFVPALTTCDWKIILVSTRENTAGIAPVVMLKRASARDEIGRIAILGDNVRVNPMDSAVSASIDAPVRFYAQLRTDHDKMEMMSGTAQFIHDGNVISSLPLTSGTDENAASVFAVDVTWKPETAQYLGTNTVKFVVKIGSVEFTSSGDFKLTK